MSEPRSPRPAAVRSGITPRELADVMIDRGRPIAVDTILYHCRDPRGQLYHAAGRVAGRWYIDPDAADRFAANYEPYGTLKKH